MSIRLRMFVIGVIMAVVPFWLGYSSAHAATAARHPAGWSTPAFLTNQGPWAAAIKPRVFYPGNGHAPWVTKIHWKQYGHYKGKATGLLHAYKTTCLNGPSPSTCKPHTIKVTIVVNHTKFKAPPKNGNPGPSGYYFSVQTWNYTGSGYAAQRRWTVHRNGYWQ